MPNNSRLAVVAGILGLIGLFGFGQVDAAENLRRNLPAVSATATPAVSGGVHLQSYTEPKPESPAASSLGRASDESFVGPDGFGYSVTDSNDAIGPTFQWQDISSTGVDLTLADDAYAYPISLPFTFNFYGQDYDAVAVGSNGVLYFEDSYLGLDNTSIPQANSYDVPSFVAVYWDDLDPGEAGAVYYQIVGTAPARRLIVQWQGVPLFGDPADTLTAQAILFEATNDILVQYLNPSSEAGARATEGIQGDVTTGILYGYDQPILTSDLALCYAFPGNATDCSGDGLVLEKTVGLDSGTCSSRDMIIVDPGTEVAYCYKARNISGITFTRHDLDDSELGTLVSSLPLTLAPQDETEQVRTGVISQSTTNIGTWTAYNPGPTDQVSAADTATVLVPEASPLSCVLPAVEFEDGIPSDWSVVDDQGNGVVWTLSGPGGYPYECGESNYTSGTGRAACVSSEAFVNQLFDTSLVSPTFSLEDVTSVSLTYQANYRNFANLDYLDLDISTDGGSNWTNLLSWNDDHGATASTPGELVSVDLTAYIGEPNLRLRWRYHIAENYAWYAQIDEVHLDCSAPSLDVTPTSVSEQLYPGETDLVTISLGNTGDESLHWTIDEQADGATACTPQDIPWLSVDPASGTTASDGSTDVELAIDATGLAAGSFAAELCVSSDDPVQPMLVVPIALTVDPLADLAISKSDDHDPAYVLTTQEYSVTVTNSGPSDASGLTLVDTLPPESTFLGVLSGPWSCGEDGGVLTCVLSVLAEGDSAVLTYLQALPGKEGMITNQADVSANEFDPETANNTVSENTFLTPRRIYLPLIMR